MSVIGFSVEKGGVGKTTLSVHMAIGAAQAGKRVVLLDADPQGNASSWLNGNLTNNDVYNLLMTPGDTTAAARRAIKAVTGHNVGIVAGNNTTSDAMVMLSAVGRLKEITDRVQALAGLCDLVIIDMPPSRNAGFLDLVRACDWIIVPTQLERHSVEGVTLMARVAQQLCDEGQGPRLMGVIPNQAKARTVLHRTQMKALMATFGQAVWPAIPGTIQVAEVTSVGSTLYKEYPHEQVTLKMRACLKRMMEVLDGTQGTRRTATVRSAARC
jgi:chromosome partitioning protein